MSFPKSQYIYICTHVNCLAVSFSDETYWNVYPALSRVILYFVKPPNIGVLKIKKTVGEKKFIFDNLKVHKQSERIFESRNQISSKCKQVNNNRAQQ